jgi:hypothetical protein
MPNSKIPLVETKNLFASFDEHIRDDFNERILFSAPFGAGKSTFLKNYFGGQDDMIVLKLYPVNYAIAQNQDVFELIKYDLLYELLSQYPDDIQLEKEEYSWLLLSQMFVMHHMKADFPLKLILKAAKAITGAPVPEKEAVDEITKLLTDFSEFKGKMETSELAKLNAYVRSFRDKTGHAHEADHITELIISMLERVKAKKHETINAKKAEAETDTSEEETAPKEKDVRTILLIDDLDRLDPDHVFRLFNVFSAHYEEITESNKFGFDKIIFVCDVNNIQQMFHHRYGIGVEFNGYIDKFYSSEVFKFDINLYLKQSLKTLLLARNDFFRFYPDKNVDKTYVERFRLDKHDGFYDLFSYVLNQLIDAGEIRIRNFQRFQFYALPNASFKFLRRDWHLAFYPLLVLISNLERFFARPADVEKALEQAYRRYPTDYRLVTEVSRSRGDSDAESHYLIQYAMPFLLDPVHIFERDFEKDNDYMFTLKNEYDQNLYVSYQIKEDFQKDFTWIELGRITTSIEPNEEGKVDQPAVYKPNPFLFLYLAYKNIKMRKFI